MRWDILAAFVAGVIFSSILRAVKYAALNTYLKRRTKGDKK